MLLRNVSPSVCCCCRCFYGAGRASAEYVGGFIMLRRRDGDRWPGSRISQVRLFSGQSWDDRYYLAHSGISLPVWWASVCHVAAYDPGAYDSCRRGLGPLLLNNLEFMWCTALNTILTTPACARCASMVYISLHFYTSLPMLCLGYGALAGTGIGLAYTPPIQALMAWFPEKRALASGLTIAG